MQKVNEVQPSAAILSIVEPFASKRITSTETNLPISLLNLYNPSFEEFCLEDLQSVEVDISITKEEREAVERVTISQSKSNNWYAFKAGRISGTTFKLSCNTQIEKPSISLIKRVCYPAKILKEPKQIKYGKEHESVAINAYVKYMETNHSNLRVKASGFIISLQNPQFGASPDGITSCDCCGVGCLEVKCPFVLKDGTIKISEFAKSKSSCLIRNGDSYSLMKSHSYYFQIQLQMYTAELPYCDFVIWSKSSLYVERIFYDEEFCEEKILKALKFHENVIMPELLGKWFCKQKHGICETSQVWCDCQKVENDKEMIQCANVDCNIQWFHLECVKLAQLPSLPWFCRICSLQILQFFTLK